MRLRVGEAEESRIRCKPRIETGRSIEVKAAAHRAYEIVHDLTGRGIVRIQIEALGLLVVCHMMIDIQHVHRIHRRYDGPRALQLDIADNEQIGRIAHPLRGTLDCLHAGEDIEDARDLIVNEYAHILAQRSEVVHQPERRTDSVAVRTNVRCEDDGLCILQQLCRLIKRNLHASSPFSPLGRSSWISFSRR